MSNFSSIPMVFHQFFTWSALGDVDLHFSLMLVRRDNGVEEETKCGHRLSMSNCVKPKIIAQI
jgi:hypothetical protein